MAAEARRTDGRQAAGRQHAAGRQAAGSDLTGIRNIGPATAAALIAAGIPDAETLRTLGADAAYVRLIEAGERPHFIGFYVLHMALQGRPWNDCKGAEKDALRAHFDQLVAGLGAARHSLTGIEAELDRIGLPPRRR